MRRYRSGADLRRHLPGCAVCTSLCAVRSGQEAGGDRRSEDEPPNRSGYPSRRATTALSAGGTLSRPCCVPIIAFFPWFVNGFAEKFSDFFCVSLCRLYRMHNAWLGFCASQPRGVVFWGGRGGRGACLFGRLLTLPFRNPQGGLAFFVACYPRLQCAFFPPSPRPPSPPGKGENQGYFMQGAEPLASPGLNRRGHRSRGANHAPSGGLVPGGAGAGCWRCARGGLPFWSPADFAVSESAGGLAFLVAC